MSEIIVAVYENGVLRPLNQVSLKEGETVRMRIVTSQTSHSSLQRYPIRELVAMRTTPRLTNF